MSKKSTMTDEEILALCPLCVNVSRLGAYILAPDETIFFDWLVTKSVVVFKFKQFYYSQEKIEKETRIKRYALERIIKRFTAMGFLTVETKQKNEEPGRSRYYSIDFSKVVERLPEIVDQGHQHAKPMETYFSALSRMQKRKRRQDTETPKERTNKAIADRVYNKFNEVYESRVEMYNNGELTEGPRPERAFDAVMFERSAPINALLSKIGKAYDLDTIENSFIVFVDEMLKDQSFRRSISSPLAFFLEYDEQRESFIVFSSYLKKFRDNYSHKNK